MTQYTGNKVSKHTLVDALLKAKTSAMQNTHVAEVCKVVEIRSDSIKCEVLNTGLILFCATLQGLTVQVEDIVLVIFTDTDFRVNLARVKQGQQVSALTSETLHSSNYGIVVGLIFKKEEV